MSIIHTRTATLNDLDTLLEFEQGIITAERPFDVTFKKEKIYYYDIPMMITSSNFELLVAKVAGEIVGCGYAQIRAGVAKYRYENYAYLGFMYVVPAFRRMGVNTVIMDELKKWSRLQGVRELRLGVYVENDKAINAYEKAGFVKQIVQMRMELE